jgi:hypothetical protein
MSISIWCLGPKTQGRGKTKFQSVCDILFPCQKSVPPQAPCQKVVLPPPPDPHFKNRQGPPNAMWKTIVPPNRTPHIRRIPP